MFLNVCMDFCASVLSVFLWTVALAFLSVCMDSCGSVSQCLYGLLPLFVCMDYVLVFLSVCMLSCACVSKCLNGLFRWCF